MKFSKSTCIRTVLLVGFFVFSAALAAQADVVIVDHVGSAI
jgi:hypothetical protein